MTPLASPKASQHADDDQRPAIWYRFNGRELGFTGNNGSDEMTAPYAAYDRYALQGSWAFRNGGSTAPKVADFTQSYEALNTFQQGSAAGGYTVQQSGETLRSVALQLWGDASLWYKLAEANGLQGDTGLVEGQRLTLPAGVVRSHYNAATLKPYDANDAMGNVSPTSPKPPKKNKCGVFGQILLAVVAIAVTVITRLPFAKMFAGMGFGSAVGAGTAIAGSSIGMASAAGIAGAAAAAAAGSIVSQGLGVATGIQDKFSFTGVAVSVIGAGVGAGLSGSFSQIAGSSFLGDAARGALGSTITQGIGVATGLQSKFSWVGVAAAGLGNAVGLGAGRELAKSGGFFATSFGNDVMSTAASALANAATRSAIEGSSFGDNVLAALPDAIGGVLGRALGGAANDALARAEKAAQKAEGNPRGEMAQTVGGAATGYITGGGGSTIKGINVGFISRYAGLAPSYQVDSPNLWTEWAESGWDRLVGTGQGWLEAISEGADEIVVTGQRIVGDFLSSAGDNVLDLMIRLGNEQARIGEVQRIGFQTLGNAASTYVVRPAQQFAHRPAGFQIPRVIDVATRYAATVGSPLGVLDQIKIGIEVRRAPEMVTGLRDATNLDVGLALFTAATAGRGAIVSRLGLGGRAAVAEGITAQVGTSKFLGQGFTSSQAKYLASPYNGLGHHFVPQRIGLPGAISDSSLNVLRPNGISRGNFYELHYKVDPYFYGAAFPKSVGGSWRGRLLGLEKYGSAQRLWYGSPTPLKVAVGGAATAGIGGGYLYYRND